MMMNKYNYKIAKIGTPIIKTCSCGTAYEALPVEGKITEFGIWFDCVSCGSSNLVLSKEKL